MFQFFSGEVRGLQKAAYVLAGAALLSSVLALARDRLLAQTFGASTSLDLYYAAFRIPDLIFVATGALVSVFILIPELARRSEGEQLKYLDTIIAGFTLFSVMVSSFAALFAPLLLPYLFPELRGPEFLPTLTLLTRIILLQPILLGLSNILAAVTQSRHRYTLYSLSPLLYNIGIIFGIMALYPLMGMTGLALGVVIGAGLHLVIQLPSVLADGFLQKLPRVHDVKALFSTIRVSLPRALALSMSQVAFLGLAALAARLETGSIAVFMLAYNLSAVPLSIIGASYSVAAFPTLAKALSRGEQDTFLDHVSTAARYIFFWSLPVTALIVTLRAHAVRFILGSGAFDWTDTRLTAAVFALLSLSLVAQGLSLLLIRGYYAAGRTFVPFMVSIGTAVMTLFAALGFMYAFQYDSVLHAFQYIFRLSDVPGVSVLSLGVGYAIASLCGTIFMVWHFERRFPGFLRRVAKSWWESVAAGLLALVGSYAMLAYLGPLDVGSTTLSVFVRGFSAGLIGIIVAVLGYWVLGNREIRELVAVAQVRLKLGNGPEPIVVSSAEENSVQP